MFQLQVLNNLYLWVFGRDSRFWQRVA